MEQNKNVFDCIPENFFNLLSGASNSRMNAGCLAAVYRIFENEISYRVKRDTVRDTISGYLMVTGYTDPESEGLSPAERANAIIRNFNDAGWFAEDTDEETYEKMVIMTAQGIALAEFLIHLTEPEKDEYTMYLFNMYNGLKNPMQWDHHPYTQALKPAYKSAKALANSLKKLSTSIKDIIKELYEEEDLEGLTNNLESYFRGSFVKEYSRLVSEQNIHLYRPAITNELNRIRADELLYREIVTECKREEKLTDAEAEEHVYNLFNMAEKFLVTDFGNILNDIKKKINVYLNVAVGKARFIANHNENSRGYVEQGLKYMVEAYKEDEMSESEKFFRVLTQSYIDLASIKYPNKPKIIKTPTEFEVPEPDPADLLNAAQEQLKNMNNPYSKERISKYVNNVMKGRKQAATQDFPMEDKEQALSIMAMIAHAESMGYEIEKKEGYITRNGYTIGNFEIKVKEAADGNINKA